MDVFACIKTRRSIRRYLDIPVEWDKVGEVLEAGRFSPTSGNIQDWNFIVVKDEDKRKKLAEAALSQHWMSQAPVHIVVTADLKKSERFYGVRGNRLYSIQNSAAAIQNMLLAAHALGLGACWVGAFDENAVGRILNIPDWARPQAIITLGYTDEKPKEPQRYPLTTVVFLESFGNKIKDIDAVMHDYSMVIERGVRKGSKDLGKSTGTFLGKLTGKEK